MVERVGLDDFNEIPSDAPIGGVPPVNIVSFDEFVGTEEDTAGSLLGTDDETILPIGGMLLMYGDGGAGKTTLTIDAVCHMAAGEPWLGIDVIRPVRSLIIENEGPRGKFRRKLAEKFASWNGHPPFNTNIRVMEDPWTMFSLREETHRHALAVSIATAEIDLVVMGPLVTLGMVGGGTPDEVSDFETLLRMTRSLVPRPFAFWTVHHENKAGDVAGAWERVPDALVHVQAQGNGHTRMAFRKARWADESHGKSLDLRWTETGRSYELKEDDDRDLHAELLAAFAEDDAWRTYAEAATLIGSRQKATKIALSDLVERGDMAFAKGPPGRHKNALCYMTAAGAASYPGLWDNTGEDTPNTHTGGVSYPVSHRKKGTVGTGEDTNVSNLRGVVSHTPGEVDEDDTTTPSF